MYISLSICFFLFTVLAPAIQAQQDVATVVVYVTMPPSTSPSAAVEHQQAVTTSSTPQQNPTTFATQLSSTTPSAQASSSAPASTATAQSSAGEYNAPGAGSGSGAAVDTAAGASGSDTASFSLSKGGLAAIIIVVVLVAPFGIASTVLFIIAKRRQWTMRETFSRASRRLTGRFTPGPNPHRSTAAANRQSRRAGVRMESPPRPGVKAVYPPGHKRGLVVNRGDLEKGPRVLEGRAPQNTRTREKSWVKGLWGHGWK